MTNRTQNNRGKTKRGSVRQKILDALQTCGPMTRAEIERECGLQKTSAAASVAKMLRPNTQRSKRPKLIYVHDWVRVDSISGHEFPRRVYAIGDKPNKPKPCLKAVQKERNARYWQRRKMVKQGAGASIFHFAMSQAKGGHKDVIEQFSKNCELAA
jgi:hypothetical protein